LDKNSFKSKDQSFRGRRQVIKRSNKNAELYLFLGYGKTVLDDNHDTDTHQDIGRIIRNS